MMSFFWRRNLVGIVAFVFAFSAAIGLTNWLEPAEQSTDINASLMTRPRVNADTAMRHSDYKEAVLHLTDLLRADPHNSHARFQLARCYHNQFVLLKRSQTQPSQTVAASADPAMAKVKRQAIATLQRCQKSHRYRERATLKLAEIHAADQDRDSTMAALKQWSELTRQGGRVLLRTPGFRFLVREPEFHRLVEKPAER